MPDFTIIDEELPTVRDFTSSCTQVFYDFLGILLLILKTCLQTFSMLSTAMKSVKQMKNVVLVQVSKTLGFVILRRIGLFRFMGVSDIYHIAQFLHKMFFSIAITYYVLNLKDTYVWEYYLEHVIVPIVTVAIPLQVCINRQLLGPSFVKQSYVVVTLWVCNTILIYCICMSFVNVHLHHVHYKHVDGQDAETRVILNHMDIIHLLALMDIPINLAILASRALKVNTKKYNYTKTEKNNLTLNVLGQCASPLIGFIVCFRSRSGYVYPAIYAYQSFSWVSAVVSLAVYLTYETMISDTFSTLSEAEVSTLSDDDICPVCLLGHSTESCRLACGHLAHSSCLISLMQNGGSRKCPMCRVDIHLNESGDANTVPRSSVSSTNRPTSIGSSVGEASTMVPVFEILEGQRDTALSQHNGGSEERIDNSNQFSARQVSELRQRLRLHHVQPVRPLRQVQHPQDTAVPVSRGTSAVFRRGEEVQTIRISIRRSNPASVGNDDIGVDEDLGTIVLETEQGNGHPTVLIVQADTGSDGDLVTGGDIPNSGSSSYVDINSNSNDAPTSTDATPSGPMIESIDKKRKLEPGSVEESKVSSSELICGTSGERDGGSTRCVENMEKKMKLTSSSSEVRIDENEEKDTQISLKEANCGDGKHSLDGKRKRRDDN